jgi:hypothetical protein
MMWRHFTILGLIMGLIGALAGCDNADISGMERRVFFNAADLAAMPNADGLLVEIHGTPWPGATPEQMALALHMPDGVAKAVRFRAASPGQWVIGDGQRLVLHFNPIGAPDHIADCKTREAFQTKPPAKRKFTVSATFCKKEEWLIHAYLKAKTVGQDDWFNYTISMQRLLGKLFPEK